MKDSLTLKKGKEINKMNNKSKRKTPKRLCQNLVSILARETLVTHTDQVCTNLSKPQVSSFNETLTKPKLNYHISFQQNDHFHLPVSMIFKEHIIWMMYIQIP